MTQEIQIHLGYLPSAILSPNWRPFSPGSKYRLAAERAELIQDVVMLAKDALSRAGISEQPAFERVTITYSFICPNSRRRDADNYVCRMKAAQDALVKAGVIADDTHEHVSIADPIFEVQKGRWETIITITPAERRRDGKTSKRG